MIVTEYQGIYFFEHHPKEAQVIGTVNVSIGGILKSAQLANLNDVKDKMVRKCRSQGGNAIINFTYGQKSSGYLASIFSRDDVPWYGKGQIAIVPNPSAQK